MNDCTALRKLGEAEPVEPVGPPPRLEPGSSPVTFSLAEPRPTEFRFIVSLTKVYP